MGKDASNFIARHEAGMSREALVAQISKRLANLDALRESLPERPRNLTAFAADAYRLAGLSHMVTPDSPEILAYLRLLARAIGADAARRAPGSAPVEVDLGKTGPIAVPRTDERPPALLRLRDVVDAYHAAFAAGDRPGLALLASAPLDRITAVPPQAEERVYMLPHAEGLQMLAQHVDGDIDMLLKAIRGCESADMIPVARDAARLHASPEIELALLHGKTDQDSRLAGLPTFDEALRNALVMHRQYWRDFEPNPGERREKDPRGFIALGPLAWATLRRDRGLPVNITSDYLPRSVIESHRHDS
jgi:hypothetical protein